MIMARIPLAPVHPERTCWGCDKYCPADDLRCGNGTVRTLHPLELFGDDWLEWTNRREERTSSALDPLDERAGAVDDEHHA